MATKQEVERAKQQFLAEAEDCVWLQSVGVGLVDGELGLVINVRAGAKPAARRLLKSVGIEVPVLMRVVKEIQVRASSEDEAESLQKLRASARTKLQRER